MGMTVPRLGLSLWAGWDELPEGSSGNNPAYAFRCTYVPYENQLDFWMLRFAGGEAPNITPEKLADASKDEGRTWFRAEPQRTLTGVCRFGHYGTAMFHTADIDWGQVWHVSNGRDSIIARYTLATGHPLVVADVQHIVLSAHFSTADE
jgi:hypothetical protein